MISERERGTREGKKTLMGWRDVKVCLVYNLRESACLTCHLS